MRRMSRRLKGVAAGTAGNFASRNNDLLGYWAIGKLCLTAEKSETETVLIDVLNMTANPHFARVEEIAEPCRERLFGHMRVLKLSPELVSSAIVEVRFEKDKNAWREWSGATHRFEMRVALTDRNGRVYIAQERGVCWPHDRSKESQSTRGRE